MDDLNAIISQLSKELRSSEAEAKKMISAKQKELSGLVSSIGAAHIVANERGVSLSSTPSEQSSFKIHDLMKGMNSVDLAGRVKAVYEPRVFKTKDGGEGKVGSLELLDDTASVRMVLWDDNADLLSELKKNDTLSVKGGYVRDGLRGIELHCGKRGKIEVNPEGAPELPKAESSLLKASELKPGLDSVDFAGRITSLFSPNSFSRKDGSPGKVSTAILADSTGTVRCSCWGSHSDAIHNFSVGDAVKIENAYVKQGIRGPELNLGWRGRIMEADDSSVPPLEKFRPSTTRTTVKSLQQGDSYKEIRAAIVDINSSSLLFHFCPKCNKRAEGACPECNAKAEPRLIINLMLDDGTGTIRSVFYNRQAEKLLGMTAAQAEKMDPDSLLASARQSLGKEMIVSGNVKFNNFSGEIELVARQLGDVDPARETEMIINSKNQSKGGKK